MSYKRNQIEEAIARLFDPKSEAVPVDLRTRIKRLFELDRSLGRSVRSKDPELANYRRRYLLRSMTPLHC